MAMRDSVGSGVRRPPGRRPFPYLSGKPSPIGERGVRSAECDRARWVTVVSTLGAWTEESSSPPSLPPSCHSMASGALGSEAISVVSIRKTYLLFPPLTIGISKH